jgi:hypothetical protein
MLSRCDCTPEQRDHPAHEELHLALAEMLESGEFEIVGGDREARSMYRRAGPSRQGGTRDEGNRFGRSGGWR